MRIAIICDVLGEENNGTTIAAMNLIRSLKEKGHEVRIVCPDPARAGERDCFLVPTYNLGPLNNYVAKNGVSLAKPVHSVLEEAIEGVDVVHILVPFNLGRAAVKLARERGIPVTASFHCQAENLTSHLFLMNARRANNLTYDVFYRNVYQYCACIHYPTQFICDVFEKRVGPTPHYIISNGVSAAFTPGKATRPAEWGERFVILFTGRYSKEKSHRVLIDAVAQSRYKDRIQLVFAGDGPLREAIRERAERSGILPPVMKFYGREELINVIRSADLYVHPAEIEIEAIACLEAIACGKVPVISNSPRSATRYFALGENNLFHCNDPADLKKKIEYWMEHPAERETCSREYAGFAKRFDYTRCMDQMEEMLLDAVNKKRHER
ncbi:MAG: glycosyltransferase [Clostridiales bacterium]|nr:MAG: glycosyltransferase [Clostridiales bacterium]